MSSETQWSYFDKQRLPPWVRRRRQIGRAEVVPLDWQRRIDQALSTQWSGTFLSDVVDAFVWMCPDSFIPEIWTLWALSNGGVYVAPVDTQKHRVNRHDRAFDELVHADTAGLIATMLAANWHASLVARDFAPTDKIEKLSMNLKAFAQMHPDTSAIFSVLD